MNKRKTKKHTHDIQVQLYLTWNIKIELTLFFFKMWFYFLTLFLLNAIFLYEIGQIQWVFSWQCGYRWPGALAPGHQYLQCCVPTHVFQDVYGLRVNTKSSCLPVILTHISHQIQTSALQYLIIHILQSSYRHKLIPNSVTSCFICWGQKGPHEYKMVPSLYDFHTQPTHSVPYLECNKKYFNKVKNWYQMS